MSKYADIEQIKEVIRTEWVKYMPMELDVNLSFVLGKIAEVPTIEVSEDCISREYLSDKVGRYYAERGDFGSFECYWILDAIKDAPSVVPTTEQSSIVGECPYFIDGVWCNLVGKEMKG